VNTREPANMIEDCASGRGRLIDWDAMHRAVRPVRTAEAASAGDSVAASRERLKTHPVAQWRKSLETFNARVLVAEAALSDATAAFDEASEALAAGTDGAERQQDSAHKALTTARADLEKATLPRNVAARELAASEAAERIVARDDRSIAAKREYTNAQARAREALKAHEEAIAALGKTDHALRCALADLAEKHYGAHDAPLSPGSSLRDTTRLFKICYAGVLPVQYAPGEYDFFKGGMRANADASSEPAVLPTFSLALSNYI
jgi:hypothetical protein